jgi:hypothetical protein
VAALRRITAFPDGLALAATVAAVDVHAEAAGRRERQAVAQRAAEAVAREELETSAQHETAAMAGKEGPAAVERDRLRRQARIEQSFLRRFDGGDTLRLAVLTREGERRWLDPYESTSSSEEDRYWLEASFWTSPLPEEGLLTLACAWPEIGLPDTTTDVLLPDLAARAAACQPLWSVPKDL